MFRSLWSPFQKKLIVLFHTLQRQIKTWAKPLPLPVTAGVHTDLPRTKTDLILENALLRHRLVVLQRHVKRPHFTWKDRIFMVVTASRLPAWRQALLIVQPDTVLRWHRDLFKHIWRRKSRQRGGHPPLNPEIVALIQQMAAANRLWGAERIRGELRKLGWRAGKGTVLNYLRRFRSVRPPSQTWKTFLRNHADACMVEKLRLIPTITSNRREARAMLLSCYSISETSFPYRWSITSYCTSPRSSWTCLPQSVWRLTRKTCRSRSSDSNSACWSAKSRRNRVSHVQRS